MAIKLGLFLAVVVATLAGTLTPVSTIVIENEQVSRETPICDFTDKTDIENLIFRYACLEKIEPQLPYWIAKCESGLQNIPNKEGPTFGVGPFQFISSTWNNLCEGDIWNAEDNVKCGVKLIADGQLYHWEPYSGSCWLSKSKRGRLESRPPG